MSPGQPEHQPEPPPPSAARDKLDKLYKPIYALAIFSSAFLLFQVQPLIAKIILPWFGGAAAVWTICLLFFQTVLLLGYLYAHLLTRIRNPRSQASIHAAFIAASLLVLPILPKDSWKPLGFGDPSMRILLLLALTVGMPYFLLSATSPLLQSWFSRSQSQPQSNSPSPSRSAASPYRFYALSNIGSMLALLTYPVLVEPRLSSTHQALDWSLGYAAVAILCAAIGFLHRHGNIPTRKNEPDPPPNLATQTLWVALPACSSALLLSITSHISQNVAAVPFIWIIPLSLYLLSFILCFDGRGWYHRNFFLRFLGLALASMAYALAPSFAGLPFKVQIALFCTSLFACCMFCHGELVRLKPHPQRITRFYLMIALGGALGAVFVALVSPHLFSWYYELEIAIGACAILVLIIHYRDPESPFYKAHWRRVLVLAVLVAAVIASLSYTAREQSATASLMVRNFYGVLRVVEEVAPNVVVMQGKSAEQLDGDPRYRKLMNGTIDHGLQFLAPDRRRQPTTYYGPASGVGIALRAAAAQRENLRVGVIGLGAGTLAAYGRPGDRYTFYEINPLDVQIAQQQFTFLRDSGATINIVPGDARLSLERAHPQAFDALVVDAFSGDSIPVHLLTREAFELYFRQLRPEGVLAVHTSNKFLDLEPVVAAAAASLDREAVIVDFSIGDNRSGTYAASWILLGRHEGFIAQSEIEKAGKILPPPPGHQRWTDEYSSLFRILK